MTKEEGSVNVGFKSDGGIAIEILLPEERILVPISLDEAICLASALNDLICISTKGLAKEVYEMTIFGPNSLQ